MTWWAGGYPARVAVINQNSNARDIVLSTGGAEFQIGALRGGETRIVRIPSGEPLEVRFTASRPRVWRSPDKITPGSSVVIYIRNDESVEMRDKITAR